MGGNQIDPEDYTKLAATLVLRPTSGPCLKLAHDISSSRSMMMMVEFLKLCSYFY